jgi:2-keto-4-pentenoate hydratase/2-oxohepta-3-ene-1,7-dioic acid hydratase in catechol pathway
MRFLMYEGADGPTLGLMHGDEVVDLRARSGARGAAPLPDLCGLIESGEEGLARVRWLMDDVGEGLPLHKLEDLRLRAPLDPPRGNVLAIGHNYGAHAEELARARGVTEIPPTVFTKAQTTIIGPHDDIPLNPAVSTMMDWEVELGVIIGTAGINIPREHALDYVFGYTVVNDVTARDIQYGWGGQFFKGKSLDGSCPFGPVIVTRDEVPDPHNLSLSLKVNGEVKQAGHTGTMIHRIDELIAMLSLGMTLLPGTLIATGTPPGVGYARTPKEFLQPGDVMESKVEGIGTLRNTVIAVA